MSPKVQSLEQQIYALHTLYRVGPDSTKIIIIITGWQLLKRQRDVLLTALKSTNCNNVSPSIDYTCPKEWEQIWDHCVK